MRTFLSIAFMLTLAVCSAQKTIIHCGKLIDVKAGKLLKEMSIIVEGKRIIDVVPGYQPVSKPDLLIDLRAQTVMPGWIDSHVHMEWETSAGRYLEEFTFNPADYAYQSVRFAEKTLLIGFTTVRDLGGTGVNISLRNAINKGTIIGPRVYTAGRAIASTGGHADPTNGYRNGLAPAPNGQDVANGVDQCRAAVRQRYKDGSDLIKITASGGVISVAKSAENPQFTEEEMKSIVATAKDYGFTVAAHCHGAEAMKRAVRAGVTSIEHGTYMDDETMALMKEYKTWYVPTLTAARAVADSAKKPGYYPELVTPKALAIGPRIQGTFAKAWKAGVKIAFGTDAGVYAHGKNWMEFQFMVEGGMPLMDAIQSATVNAATMLNVFDNIGSIDKGKFADIIAVDGDPFVDIQALGRMKFVMKEGKVYKN